MVCKNPRAVGRKKAGKALPGPFEDRDVWILREKSSFRDHPRQWHRYTGDLVFKEGTIPSEGISRRNLKTEVATAEEPDLRLPARSH